MSNNKIKPPAFAQRILLFLLRNDLAEEVTGDLEEKFYAMVEAKGPPRAKLNYWYQLIHYIRPFALRKIMVIRFTIFFMFNNYTKLSFRNLLRQKLYSFINIGGLAIGIAAFILITLYVQHELSFDHFLSNRDQIYRIYQRQEGNEFLGSDYFAVTPAQLATVLPQEFPEVSAATRINDNHALLGFNDQVYYERGLLTDNHFFDVFHYDVINGNAAKALPDAKSIVLTKSLALKIFGDKDPVGQPLKYQNEDVFTVTAVMQDIPPTSSIQFSYLVHIRSSAWAIEQLDRARWDGNSVYTFFTLPKTADPLELQGKLTTLHAKYRDPEAYADYPFIDEYFVQPLTELHLQSNINEDIGLKGNPTYLYLFSAVGLLILILACVNYMNLAVARSIKRAKEVGVRKVMGALRSQLIFQFLGDSVFISFFALIVGVGLTYLLLPFFSQLIDRTLTLDFLQNGYLLPGLLLLTLFVGILSGSYPAFVMSGHRPAEIVKGKIRTRLSGFNIQRVLIVAQFAVSLVLVVCSLVIYFQLRFIQQKQLGYEKEHVLVIKAKEHLSKQRVDALRNEWLQDPHILAVSRSNHLPTNISSSTLINDENGSKGLAIYQCRTDYDFLDVFGIRLIAGRNFSPDVATDTDQGYLINETAARALGWTPETAVGKQFTHEGVETVIGVVKDFHMHSMHLTVQPLMIRLRPEEGSDVSVKLSQENIGKTIAFLEKSFKKQSAYPFEYQFLDEHFNDLYKSDIKLGETFKFFTLLSMIIAALGLFGLAAFMAVQRTKEIGIRKVLGASSGSIVMLLGKDFLLLVALAFLISIPVSWYSMHLWLQGFAYRIDMEWWMFAAAGVLAFIVANITIGYQSLKASWMDPVDSLRSE